MHSGYYCVKQIERQHATFRGNEIVSSKEMLFINGKDITQ